MTRPTMILAQNAVVGVGGQGLNLEHMLEAYRPALDVTAMCRGGDGVRAVAPAGLVRLAARTPIVRRRRDWITLADDVQFDRAVARAIPRGLDAFQGAVGQCAGSLRAARRAGARTVLDVGNLHVDDFHPHVIRECRALGVPHFAHPLARARILAEYDAADVIRVMSGVALRTFLARGFPRSRLVVATPPVDLAQFPPAGFRGPRFRISFVGMIEPWKGVHHLLTAYARLALPDAELFLWGGSGSRAMTRLLGEYQARHPGIHAGPVAMREVGYGAVYGTSSVLVHPSLSDGFAYAVVEAMASGLPVIVTDRTGAADLVVEGENGFVVPAGDVDALVDRLRHLAAHPELLPEMGRRARDAVRRLTPDAFRTPLLRAVGLGPGEA
jgi:glycosyltransferase involved in cell wall biosynthesis